MRLLLALLALFSVVGCAAPEQNPTQPVTESGTQGTTLTMPAEAMSLLGTELFQLASDSATTARQEAQLAEAQAALDAAPGQVDSWIWLGRRTAYLSRYREAIDIYSEGLDQHPDSPHLLRHRGHRYLSLREFDLAIADFVRAAELTDGTPDEVEPDGQPNASGIPTSTLQTNIWYHLSLAYYYKGEFAQAAEAMQACFDLAANNDMKVAAADWLYMSLRRAGMDEAARSAIDFVTPELEILENHAYHRRILMYKGAMEPDDLLGDGAALEMATQGYGVGNWYLLQGQAE
ncbi:MAG: tetratricopeptide (TPR) repeat protein, partial [Rhodothermales bacterium]